jgi:hypothetical protein
MNLNQPVEVYSVNEPFKAEVVKEALEAEGIRCFLGAPLQGAFAGINFEPVRVFVEAAEADRARQLIAAHEQKRHDEEE